MVNPDLVYCKFFASHLTYRRDAEHRCYSRLKRLWTEGRMMLFGEFRIQGTQNRSVGHLRFLWCLSHSTLQKRKTFKHLNWLKMNSLTCLFRGSVMSFKHVNAWMLKRFVTLRSGNNFSSHFWTILIHEVLFYLKKQANLHAIPL